MYNSSLKGEGRKIKFGSKIEIPHKVFFNDMSKNYWHEDFERADCIYSGIAWMYGYKIFNQEADNIPNSWAQYVKNINSLIEKMRVPAFITGGKQHIRFFPNAQIIEGITLNNNSEANIPLCRLFVWNYDIEKLQGIDNTMTLLKHLAKEFKCPLDFSCGYGEHLLRFDDFIGCDIDRNCLTYLSILYQEKEKANGTTKN